MSRDRPDLDAFGRPVQPERTWSVAEEHAPPPAATSTNPQAVAAIVCGILGFVLAPVVLSIAAIVLGTSGVRRADALPGAPGRSLAQVGRGLGWASLVLYGLLILAAVAYVA